MLELASMRGTGVKIQLGNLNIVWKCQITSDSGIYTAYIKEISHDAIYTECVCAMAGRSLGLNIPKPFIVTDGVQFYFGSEDAGYESFKQFVDAGDSSIAKALLQWARLNECAIFDEWIGNGDRNQGNFLFDGAGDFTLIDHESAFGGNGWHKSNPKPATDNQYASCINNQGDLAKLKLRKEATKQSTVYEQINHQGLCKHNIAVNFISMQNQDNVLSFLINQSDSLVSSIQQRTGIPPLI